MLFEVAHLTRFSYERPVRLEPLTVRLRPRSDLFQRLISFDLVVDPAPEGSTDLMDVEGNAVTLLWFLGAAPSLSVRTLTTVETLRPNPYDYIMLDPGALALPPAYPLAERLGLARYLEPPDDPAVAAFAADVVAEAGGGATTFLGALCARVAAMIAHEVRPTGDPLPAAETLRRGRGACRDRAVLFIEACRSASIAARFVTGYELGEARTELRDAELHAWAEVYLTGAGWRAYDPSQGLAVADRHVAVAAGAGPAEAAPTAGTYRGTGVASTLETLITLRVVRGRENVRP